MSRTLVLLKPDAVQRALVGDLIARLERRGLKIVGMKLMQVSEELAHRHYGEHEGKPFFPRLVRFITSSPIVAMVLEGENAVQLVRATMGQTSPVESTPGSVRGDYGMTIGMNLVHGSDSDESAQREISLFFSPDEILSYERDVDKWIIES
jgi:nucleoside-diphosphate kinase